MVDASNKTKRWKLLHNEIIMNYSIHDAIEAVLNKIRFVLCKDIEADFKEKLVAECSQFVSY